jgi:hypothetical protein
MPGLEAAVENRRAGEGRPVTIQTSDDFGAAAAWPPAAPRPAQSSFSVSPVLFVPSDG